MSIQSEVDICNVALAQLGAEIIENFQDTSQTARLCSLFYPRTRDELLAKYRWNFSMFRATLTQLTDAPTWGFDFAYALPNDYIRVWDTDIQACEWRIENRTLVTDQDSACILYGARVTNPGIFSEGFRRALELKMAAILAMPLTRQPNLTTLFEGLFETELMDARTFDSQENAPEVTGPGDDIFGLARIQNARGRFRPFND